MAKYSKGAGKKVEEAMHERKEGTLKSGRSGKKVTSREQAIAIGLSEARERGEKVPGKGGNTSTGRTSNQSSKSASGGSKFGGSKQGTKSAGGRKSAFKPAGCGGGSNRSKSSKGGAKAAKKTSVTSKKGK